MKLFTFFFILFSLPVLAQGQEGMSWEESSINDKIKLTISLSEFEDRYKKADSIADALTHEFCNPKDAVDVKMLYYKGIKFELKNGMLNFRSIDFSKRRAMYFAIDGDWFDHTTSLKSLSRSFPEATQYVEDYENEDGEEFKRVIVFPKDLSKNYDWNFDFKNGKLHSIEFHQGCK